MTPRHAVRLVGAASVADTAPLTLAAAVRLDDLRLDDPPGLPPDPPLLLVAARAVVRAVVGLVLFAVALAVAVASTVPYAAIGIALVLSGVVPVPVTLLAIVAVCGGSAVAVHRWERWR